MKQEPREKEEYEPRQVQAARRVLMDIGQVLASFTDCIVVVGGWTPDLLLPPETNEPHIGSIDVDLALDVEKLADGRYAELIKLLLDTKRYHQGPKDFQLTADVDLKDGGKPVLVEVDFLAIKGAKLKKNKPKLLQDFRVQEVDACAVAFHAPLDLAMDGQDIRGTKNTVHMQVISLADFLIMKAYAIGGRDKPKDTYDLCYCLDRFPGGLQALADDWRPRLHEREVAKAVKILEEKFASVDHFGPQQLVEFHQDPDTDAQAMHARQAYELVRKLLSLLK